MSLYAYGKLVTSKSAEGRKLLLEVAQEASISLTESQLDEEDARVLNGVVELRGPGFFFTLSGEPGSADATALWIDAMEAGRADSGGVLDSRAVRPRWTTAGFTRTRLGAACKRLFQAPIAKACGLALVDGGIDDVFVGSADQCLEAIAAEVLKPWDATSNRLYVARRVAA